MTTPSNRPCIRSIAQVVDVVSVLCFAYIGLVAVGCRPRCGDGVKQCGESCDDGNQLDIDTCSNSCKLVGAFCGNGIVDDGEQCDDGNVTEAPCTSACLLFPPICGDMVVTPLDDPSTFGDETEECDDGNVDDNDVCTNMCKAAVCGDSSLYNSGAGTEQCDDGNSNDHDDCTSQCVAAMCGDGSLHNQGAGTEQCDDGNNNVLDSCPDGPLGTCNNAFCGDSFLYVGVEECDDVGVSATCDGDCTAVECGDTTINILAGEACDDGGTATGDGCDASCLLEIGEVCVSPGQCASGACTAGFCASPLWAGGDVQQNAVGGGSEHASCEIGDDCVSGACRGDRCLPVVAHIGTTDEVVQVRMDSTLVGSAVDLMVVWAERRDIRYNRYSSGSWAAETSMLALATGDCGVGIPVTPAVAFDKAKRAIAVWNSGDQMCSARYSAGVWRGFRTIANDEDSGLPVDFHRQATAVPHPVPTLGYGKVVGATVATYNVDAHVHAIAVYRTDDGTVVAHFDGRWGNSLVVAEVASASDQYSIDVNSSGEAIVGFSTGTELYAIRYDGSAWQSRELVGATMSDTLPGVTIDDAGVSYMAWQSTTSHISAVVLPPW